MPRLRKSQLLALVVFVTIVLLQGNEAFSKTQLQAFQPEVKSVTFTSLAELPVLESTWQRFVRSGEVTNFREFQESSITQPEISASAALVLDVASSTILYQRNAEESMSPASTTKMMTALVALEVFTPQTVLTVTAQDLRFANGLGLTVGEQFVVEDLIKALLITSSNEAAEIFAREHPAGYEGFIQRMNTRAEELGLVNTRFANPTGYDSPNQVTTASDLRELTSVLMADPFLSVVVREPLLIISDLSGSRQHLLQATNKLLLDSELKTIGVKTGTTPGAKEVLVSRVVLDGREIDIIVMGSTDRYADTKSLANWAATHYTWVPTSELLRTIDSRVSTWTR